MHFLYNLFFFFFSSPRLGFCKTEVFVSRPLSNSNRLRSIFKQSAMPPLILIEFCPWIQWVVTSGTLRKKRNDRKQKGNDLTFQKCYLSYRCLKYFGSCDTTLKWVMATSVPWSGQAWSFILQFKCSRVMSHSQNICSTAISFQTWEK